MSGRLFRRVGSLIVPVPAIAAAYMAQAAGQWWLVVAAIALAVVQSRQMMAKAVCPACERDLLYCCGEWAGIEDYRCPTCGYGRMEDEL